MKNHEVGTLVLAYNDKNPILGIVSKVTIGPHGEVRYKIDWNDYAHHKTIYIHDRVKDFIDTYEELKAFNFDTEKLFQSYKEQDE